MPTKGFGDTLKEVRDGELLNELTIQMRDLVEAVRTTGKLGKLQITLSLSPSKGGVLLLDDHVKLTRPEPERDTSTVFFPTEENDLSRRDPRQPKLPELGGPRGVVASLTQAPVERTDARNG